MALSAHLNRTLVQTVFLSRLGQQVTWLTHSEFARLAFCGLFIWEGDDWKFQTADYAMLIVELWVSVQNGGDSGVFLFWWKERTETIQTIKMLLRCFKFKPKHNRPTKEEFNTRPTSTWRWIGLQLLIGEAKLSARVGQKSEARCCQKFRIFAAIAPPPLTKGGNSWRQLNWHIIGLINLLWEMIKAITFKHLFGSIKLTTNTDSTVIGQKNFAAKMLPRLDKNRLCVLKLRQLGPLAREVTVTWLCLKSLRTSGVYREPGSGSRY